MKFVFSFFLLISSYCLCQTPPLDFTSVDRRVKEVVPASADTLAQILTAPYPTETEKVRSIFKWITENIAYDTKGYYNLNTIYRGLFRQDSSSDSATVYKNYNDNIVKKVLTEKVAICDGYSRLFKTLCDYANIKSEIVIGYVRWHSDSIGAQTKRIHAWNAVQIDNEWHLLDATWASGYSNKDVTKFKREYDDYYFLTPPGHLINDHFPLESKWALLSHPITINAFYDQPYLFPAFRKYKINSFKPLAGLIVTKVGSEISFELETNGNGEQMDVVPSLTKNAEDAAESKSDIKLADLLRPGCIITVNKVAYTYNVRSPETKELNVIYKGEIAIRYRVRLEN